MSEWGKVPREVFLDDRLTRRDLRVLGILCTHADGRTGICTRKQEAIAEEIGSDRSGVNRSIAKLVQLGYVDTHQRAGMKRSLQYRVLVREASAGQMSLFDAREAPRQAKPRVAKRAEKSTSVVLSEGTSVVPTSGTSNKQTPDNRSYAASRAAPANDQPKIDPQPDAVPVAKAPGAVPTSQIDVDALEDRLIQAAGAALDPMAARLGLRILTEPLGWLDAGCDLHFDVLPTIAGMCARPGVTGIKSWRYFAEAVRQARDRRLAAALPAPLDASAGRPVPAVAVPRPKRRSMGDRVFDRIQERFGHGDEPQAEADPDPQTTGDVIDVAFCRR
ncbi:helix-turn-helix domain-containing protein [Aureimonas phyllosphaerae]|uniref:Helix-turn-helix domain-containing protein n=1 Tax=Aureimonas phyllosphaerae TaxID=1166078 RepID=A0A7W6C3C1_9HYPH|nr:helix-turn-helix domain-containing protein [Aureimonas phyllosphaerae]MBB3937692.1 hypothetical protein [Aureimonas phyllosphaerae]MBB3961773.1 hypothetical protein [Aureimonas phyllosphaerae]SFF45131.1 Helix-turn-helix domain-containing protein [Aureimonas phyllosphaerae]